MKGTPLATSLARHGAIAVLALGLASEATEPVLAGREVFEVEVMRLPAAKPAPAPVEPPAEKPIEPPKRERPKPRKRPTEQAKPRPPPVESDVAPLPAPPEPPAQREHEAHTNETAAAMPSVESAAAASARDSWYGRIVERLERVRRYPRSARARRQQGVVWVRFTLDRHGDVRSVALERSSGYGALDRETVDLVSRALPFPAPPDEVEGETIELVVPVVFSLESASS